ncbi:MAG: hypothetical protein IBJ12_15010 [Sphingomonadaceae bacterium]|nr:hypothetical protein [Sphingomonadaceae bacterium]
MRLPPALVQQSAPIPIKGIGGGRQGQFVADAWRGSYNRSEERLAFFETFVTNRGHSQFIIEGPGISSSIEAKCRMRERVLDLEIVEFTPGPMSYRCEFTAAAQAIPARFELQEVRSGLAGALSRRERRGEIALGGETVQIRSVHKLEGTPIEMAVPIGYVFEQNGFPVGAVEINGSPRLFFAEATNENLSRTIVTGAIALAIFWDPANSALGD